MVDFKKMSEKDWKGRLTAEEFRVCRKKGTEPAFSGEYYNEKATGTYLCRCCKTPLFHSVTKYDSGSGWPSFYQPFNTGVIEERPDVTYGMDRVETLCAHCGSHVGHVFMDGPMPTGLRYCSNSLSLLLEKE
ncbi:MAG: peptide-methionine (R)-S-oxide reductase MsrB [Porticoccus sp.]|nr:peptide-methionine (R)-S-oxide reductase MsrB [Porticoccus sp.]